jgi:hypothetical protein
MSVSVFHEKFFGVKELAPVLLTIQNRDLLRMRKDGDAEKSFSDRGRYRLSLKRVYIK